MYTQTKNKISASPQLSEETTEVIDETLPKQARTSKRVAHSRMRSPSEWDSSEHEELENSRWEGELAKLKSHVNHPGNCRICRTRFVKIMALTNRKRRQLGEIGDNFEVPDEAYCRAARCLFLVNLWVTVFGEYDDYMDHLAPTINIFAPFCKAPPTCDASKYASIRRFEKNTRDRLSESLEKMLNKQYSSPKENVVKAKLIHFFIYLFPRPLFFSTKLLATSNAKNFIAKKICNIFLIIFFQILIWNFKILSPSLSFFVLIIPNKLHLFNYF